MSDGLGRELLPKRLWAATLNPFSKWAVEGHCKFLGVGGGVLEAKSLEPKYEAKLEFLGDGGCKTNNLPWGRDCTIIMLLFQSAGSQTPDYGRIYTLLSRVMREQSPPNLTPLGKW